MHLVLNNFILSLRLGTKLCTALYRYGGLGTTALFDLNTT